MLYDEAKKLKAAAEAVETRANEALQAVRGIGSGPGGLTPDAVKRTAEYQAAMRAHGLAFESMRKTNQWFFKQFKNEAYAERLAKHANFG
jgi:hypothetical protein